jgi:uncharacterized protein YqjF (DUF2071 family)
MSRPFLSASWRYLVMLNYEIDPDVLRPLVPRGTELDFWGGRCYASVVGFSFLDTRVLGLPVPFHRNFPEVNLRFYVGREARDGRRRGVVFVKEVVPRATIAYLARRLYNERYVACPMASEVRPPDPARGTPGRVEYAWTAGSCRNAVRAEIEGAPALPGRGSEEEFITEHYWGYAGQRDGSAVEYHVEHPPWRVWRATASGLECDVAGFYGEEYRKALGRPPRSAFVAEGSAVTVSQGLRLRAAR